MVNAQYYFPEGGDPSVLGYLWPARSSGSTVEALVANDTMTVVRGAEHPVLAHNFLNWMLDETNALENFAWLGLSATAGQSRTRTLSSPTSGSPRTWRRRP